MPVYYDTCISLGAGQDGIDEVFTALDATTVLGAGINSVSDLLTAVDGPEAVGAGKGSGADGKAMSDTVTARAAGKGGGSDHARVYESSTAKRASRGSLTTVLAGTSSPHANGAGKVLDDSIMSAVDNIVGLAAGQLRIVDVGTMLDTLSAKGAGKYSVADKAKVSNISTAKGAGKSSIFNDVWTAVEHTVMKGGGGVQSTGALVGLDAPVSAGAAYHSVCTEDNFDYTDLIRALRYNWKQANPELSTIPETLPEGDQFDKLELPYGVILAHHPRMDTGWAVNDFAQWVSVDFIHVSKLTRDGSTDTTQSIRRSLANTINGMLSDYHQRADGTYQIVAQSELNAAPLDKQNIYQQYYAEAGQSVTVMIMTMDFCVIRSLDCG